MRARRVKWLAWHTYYRVLLSRFDAIICVSKADAAHFRRAGIQGSVQVLPNPVDVRGLEAARPRRPGTGALLYFGRLAPNKGIERLGAVLRAAPREWSVTIVGNGDEPYVRHLKEVFRSSGGRCVFRGGVPDAELADVIASHDCVVLPSRTEGFGLTLVEALATGVPVVASDIAAYREIAEDASVPLTDFDRPEDVVRSIRNAMAKWDEPRARARAASYSWEQRGPAFIDLYRRLAG
jgi:glycosyltransferase involved in cell wall biosynthesis